MSKPGDDDYHSSEDEDYKLPEDAPPENENDAYLIKNEEETTPKSSEPIRDVDDLWSDFLKPTTSEVPKPDLVPKDSLEKSSSVVIGTKRRFETAAITPATKKSSTGFGAALGMIKKTKKISVLEKSQRDWNKFVEEKSMKAELDSHNKSQDSYLDKQDFLAKADYNKFLKERECRDKARKPI